MSESDAAPASAAPAAPDVDDDAAPETGARARPPLPSHPLSLKEAARVTGRARSVFQRNREKLVEHGATVRPNGTWVIPVETLLSLGWLDRVRPTPDDDGAASAAPGVDAGAALAAPDVAAVAELRAKLAAAEERAHAAELRAAAAEATATERERALAIARQAADDQRMALRLLEASTPASPASREPERRSWFGSRRPRS